MARVRFVLVVILLGAIVIFAGGLTLVHAINCGDILGPGGNFQLQQDLDCPGPALTVRDGAILDLNGHIVTCGGIGACIALSGADAQLFDGAVLGNLHFALFTTGNGHTVKNVTCRLVDSNVLVTGDDNRLINVLARSLINPAFSINRKQQSTF